jgi:hypothetical protein
MAVIDAQDRFKKQEDTIQPVVSLLRRFICGILMPAPDRSDERLKVKAGTHRFDMYRGEAIAVEPRGRCVDLTEEYTRKMARNAELIEVWENRYVAVTDDGYEVREME